MTEATSSWKFPKVFWTTNVLELFERAAYYGAFIAMTLYLTRNVGFTDVETGWVLAFYTSLLYFFPAIMGTLSDKMGFRASVIWAFILLGVGYAFLGAVPNKVSVCVALFIIMIGGAIIKAVLSAAVARCSNDANRARAFSLFYQAVNIGSFSGRMIARELRMELGLEYINFYAAILAFIGLVVAFFFFKNIDREERDGRKFREIFVGLWHVLKNVRFLIFLMIIGGFWSVQYQMYATMPKYVLRLVGEGASPEWISNINPLVVIIFVVPVTQLVRKIMPLSSMLIAMLIMASSGIVIALSPALESIAGDNIKIVGQLAMHPVTIMMLLGIAIQALAECFMQPRFLEYCSNLAPKGEVATYMGYAYIKSVFSYFVTFVMSGYLLDAYCPDPRTLSPEQMETAYQNAHIVWYIYASIGFGAFALLFIFNMVTKRLDRRS